MITKEEAAGGRPAAGDVHQGGVFVCPQFTTLPTVCQPHDLSRRIDRATTNADAHNLAAIDHWRAAQHHAHEAIKEADRRDQALADVIRLQSQIPEVG